MKKFNLLVFFLIVLFLFSNSVYAAKTKSKTTTEDSTPAKVVNVYMLTKEGCPGCEAAYEYFDSLKEQNTDLFELVPFEVFDKEWKWNSDELQTMFTKIYEYFEEDPNKASTPTIIIGDYHVLGLPNDTSIIYNAIIDAQKKDTDVVQKIAKEENINIEELKYDRSKAAKEENETNKYDTLIIIGIFVVLIGGFAGLLILGKK